MCLLLHARHHRVNWNLLNLQLPGCDCVISFCFASCWLCWYWCHIQKNATIWHENCVIANYHHHHGDGDLQSNYWNEKKKETNEWILLLTPIKSILAQEGNQHKSRCAYQIHSSSPTQIIRAINYHPPFIMTAQDRYLFRVEFICSSFFACIWIGEKEWMWECYHKRPNHYIIYATNCCGYE